MTPAFLGIVGRTADIALVVFLLMQLALGFRMSQTVLLHLRYRRTGLERERLALIQTLPAEGELPTLNEGPLVRRALGAAASLDWPREKLQIQLLDDSTDASAEIARATVAEFRRRGHDVTLIQRSHRPARGAKRGRGRPAYLAPASHLSRCSTRIMFRPPISCDCVFGRCSLIR